MPRPSFSCRYAKTSVEHAICADPVLAAKDRRMALLYERAGGSRYGPVDPSQWGWVAARNRCGRVHDEALERCLHRAYLWVSANALSIGEASGSAAAHSSIAARCTLVRSVTVSGLK